MSSIFEATEFDDLAIPAWSGLGAHFLGDFHGCGSLPTSPSELESVMIAAAIASNATIVNSSFHEFSPHGLSGVVVIAESHLAVHTWPEHQTACVDLFTCSQQMDARPGLRLLFESFGAKSMKLTCVGRAAEE